MFPYLIVFGISIIATYCAERSVYKSFTFYIFSCLAIVPLVLLSAFRDVSVGTDTHNYVYMFQNAVEYNHNFLIYMLLHPTFEPGFLFYNFIIAQIFSNVETYYIITYGIIVGLVYASAIKLKEYVSSHIFMLVFLFLFFSDSLNIMRQYIAVAFVIWAAANLFEENNKKYIFWTIIAFLFHTSAIISIIIGGIYWFVKKYPVNENKYIYLTLSLVFFIIVVGLERFASMGILPVFESKLSSHISKGDSGVSNSHIAVCFLTVLFLFHNYRKDMASEMMFLIACLTLLFYISPTMNSTLYRLTIYFNIITCFSISYAYKNIDDMYNKCIILTLLMFYVAFYFFSIVMSGTNEVIPYSSTI